jgi:hypothetical protein
MVLPEEVAFIHGAAHALQCARPGRRVEHAGRARAFHRPRDHLEFAQEALRDLLTAQERSLSIPNIQKVVADYYQLRVADLLGKRRTRLVARPRQMAMALAKELTSHSCRRSVMPSAGATTPRCCTPAA